MSPYENFLYFGLLMYVAVPTVMLAWLQRQPRYWVLIATLAVVGVQYTAPPQASWWLLPRFVVWQAAIAFGFHAVRRRTDSRAAVWVAVLLCLLPLLEAKSVLVESAGFIGLSYLTLRCVDVLIATQDRLLATLDLRTYLSYVLFFPTIAAGPIDRYRRFQADLQRSRTRQEFLQDAETAVGYWFNGLLYKFVLAALIGRYWLEGAGMVSYMYGYTLFLFFDFAGYSALAIAVSYLLGIHTPQNFQRPFAATNIRDFWNRWHQSLSWWLRDHVYMRFVMAATRGRWFRGRYTASRLGLLLAFVLMGAWHGLQPRFLLYGLYHAALMIGYDALERWNRTRRLWKDGPGWRLAGGLITFHCVCFGVLLFTGRLWSGNAAVSTPFQGQLESVTCDGVKGWMWDRSRPDQTITVAIFTNAKRFLAEVPANLPRPDLKGVGDHGFFCPLPDELKDGYPHPVYVRAATKPRFNLPNSPQWIICGEADLRGFDGAVRQADCTLSGYAVDQTHGQVSVSVDLYLDNTQLATVTANQTTTDYGSHGFSYALSGTRQDGKPHVLHCYIAGTGYELKGSPLTIRCNR